MVTSQLCRHSSMFLRYLFLPFIYSIVFTTGFSCTVMAGSSQNLSALPSVFIKKIQLTGNTVFSNEDLGSITSRYENRTISAEELQELRQQLTKYYIKKGYINSGAVIPDQKVESGTVIIQIIEGRLTEIEILDRQRLQVRAMSLPFVFHRIGF